MESQHGTLTCLNGDRPDYSKKLNKEEIETMLSSLKPDQYFSGITMWRIVEYLLELNGIKKLN